MNASGVFFLPQKNGDSVSVEATRWVIEQRGIPLPTRAVLLVIADMVNRKGDAWPTVSTIADKCEIKRRMVLYHLSKAVELGVINVQKHIGKGSTYSFPTGAINYTTQDIAQVQDSAPSGAKNCTPPLYKNRNGTVNITKRAKEKENKSIPEWAEIINEVAGLCGGEPLTNQHIQNIEERHPHIDLKTEALSFEDHHITKHRQKPYKTFATYSRFSNTWLANTTKGFSNGFNAKRMGKPNTENSYSARDQHAPSPLL